MWTAPCLRLMGDRRFSCVDFESITEAAVHGG
jgi:hypothetical protein